VPDSLDAVQIATVFLFGLVAITLAVVLLRPVWLPVWRTFRRLQQFFDDWFGEPARPGQPARPGVMARLQSTETEVASVKTIALRSEKELHPNGGSSLRDDVRAVGAQVAQVKEAAQQATTAAGLAVNEAKVAAHVAQETAAERRADAKSIRTAMTSMREEIAQDAAERTADAYELLAEHGGPDLRSHLPGHVADHTHELPLRSLTETSGPIEPGGRD
jgi:hypothetical protein